MNNKIKSFKSNGFTSYSNLLAVKECQNLFNILKKNRPWGKKLFISQKEKPQMSKSNPGKGIQNLVDSVDLKFIEKNPKIKKILKEILGDNYEIMLSKFVVAVPKSWLPSYLKNIIKKKYVSNLNSYVKKKYRDVTYFKGSDFHMDSIDWDKKSNKFITMYIYLNKVDKYMSPLYILKKSHKLGHLPYPHNIRESKNKNYFEVSPDNKKFSKFKKEMLTGELGQVFFWTSNTLHGSAIAELEKDNFRISLRYLIKKKGKKTSLIDKILIQNRIKDTRVDKSKSLKSRVEAKNRKVFI